MNRTFSLLLAATSLGWAAGNPVHVWEKQEITLHAQTAFRNPYTDVSVWVDPEGFEAAVQRIAAGFRSISDALEFARKTRVLPIETTHGVRADIVFASLEPERRMIARATHKTIDGVLVRLAAVEDLIWMKLLSERPKDTDDARRLIRRFRASLDRAYLEPKLAEMSEALTRPAILQIYLAELRG